MDEHTIELLARRAGLDKPPAEFPEDVAEQARQIYGEAEAAVRSVAPMRARPGQNRRLPV